MKKSIIIYGPAACGKSYNGKALATHFGLTEIIELDESRQPVKPEGVLYLTNQKPRKNKIRSIDFSDAMKEAGLPMNSPYLPVNQAKQKAQAHGWELRENIGGGVSAALVQTGERPNPHTMVFPSIDQAIAYLEKQS